MYFPSLGLLHTEHVLSKVPSQIDFELTRTYVSTLMFPLMSLTTGVNTEELRRSAIGTMSVRTEREI